MSVKQQLLTALLQSKGEFISGQKLAQLLNVSRNAVWKAAASLRTEGYAIDAVTHKGYRLLAAGDLLDTGQIRACLKPEYQELPILIYDSIDSTNEEAKRLLAVGKARNRSDAAKISGISRSALYKYKDHVFLYNENIDQSVITINVYLEDRPGVLSALLDRFSRQGANILTVNQNIPADGVAPVSISARLESSGGVEELLERLGDVDGVVEVKLVSSR